MTERNNQPILLVLAALLLIASGLVVNNFVRSSSNDYSTSQASIEASSTDPATDSQVEGEATQSAQPETPRATSLQTTGDLVTHVVDGDTFVVNNATTIRIIGVDTPETVDPRRPVGCYGKEASNFSKNLLQDKRVRLEKDISETDKYGRSLRYVFIQTDQGEVFLNDLLARQGYATVKTYPPDIKYQQQFLEAEREARANKRGLWGSCPIK